MMDCEIENKLDGGCGGGRSPLFALTQQHVRMIRETFLFHDAKTE